MSPFYPLCEHEECGLLQPDGAAAKQPEGGASKPRRELGGHILYTLRHYIPALSSDDEVCSLLQGIFWECSLSLRFPRSWISAPEWIKNEHIYILEMQWLLQSTDLFHSLSPHSLMHPKVHKMLNEDINFWPVALASFPGTISHKSNIKHEGYTTWG